MAAEPYGHGIWQDGSVDNRIVCFGARHNAGLARSLPAVQRLLWKEHVLPSIYRRFVDFQLEKLMHHQWDADAKELFAEAGRSRGDDGAQFLRSVGVVGALQ